MRYFMSCAIALSVLAAAPALAQVSSANAKHICRDFNLSPGALQGCANRLENAKTDADRARIQKEYAGAIGASAPVTPVATAPTRVLSRSGAVPGAVKVSASGASPAAANATSPQNSAITGRAPAPPSGQRPPTVQNPSMHKLGASSTKPSKAVATTP